MYMKYLLTTPTKMVHDPSGGRDPRLKAIVLNCRSTDIDELLHQVSFQQKETEHFVAWLLRGAEKLSSFSLQLFVRKRSKQMKKQSFEEQPSNE